jgi:hypothetical protein
MKHKRTMAWTAAAVFCALVVGWFALSGADQTVSPHPHNKANHHAKSGDGPSN